MLCIPCTFEDASNPTNSIKHFEQTCTRHIKEFTSVYYCAVIYCRWFSVSGYGHGSNYMGNHYSQADHRQRHENNSSGFMLHCPVKPSGTVGHMNRLLIAICNVAE